MNSKLDKIIKETLQNYKPKKKSCSCGCNHCGNSVSLLNESLKHTYPISEQFRALIDAKKPLINEIKRIGNPKLIREARILFDKGILELKGEDKKLFENTDFGKYKVKGGGLILETFLKEDVGFGVKEGDILIANKDYKIQLGPLEYITIRQGEEIQIDFVNDEEIIITRLKNDMEFTLDKTPKNRVAYYDFTKSFSKK